MPKLRITDATTKVVYIVEVPEFVHTNLEDTRLEYYRTGHFLRVKFKTKNGSRSIPFSVTHNLQNNLWKIAYKMYLKVL